MSENQVSTRGIEQGRASFAYEKVKEIHQRNWAGEYKSYVKKLPMLIKTNGLGAALAFAYSKRDSKEGWKALYSQISEWLKRESHLKEEDELMEKVIQLSSAEYREVTVKVLALLSWMRRFAEGMIEKEGGDD